MAYKLSLKDGSVAWVYPPNRYDTRYRVRVNGETLKFETEQALNEALAKLI